MSDLTMKEEAARWRILAERARLWRGLGEVFLSIGLGELGPNGTGVGFPHLTPRSRMRVADSLYRAMKSAGLEWPAMRLARTHARWRAPRYSRRANAANWLEHAGDSRRKLGTVDYPVACLRNAEHSRDLTHFRDLTGEDLP